MRQVYLNFHGIGEPKRPLEEGEAPYWVSPDFFEATLALAHDLRDVVRTCFTFDDGNLSDLEIGAEHLTRHGWRAQFFVLSSRIGTPGSLGETEIRELLRMGHAIGNHGADHVDWTGLDKSGLACELGSARQRIEEVAGQQVDAAAIPFGRYNRRVLTELRKRGYRKVYSSDGGAFRDMQTPIPRTSPRADMTLTNIEAILLGRERPWRSWRRKLSMTIKRQL